jgi:hypothetical protein
MGDGFSQALAIPLRRRSVLPWFGARLGFTSLVAGLHIPKQYSPIAYLNFRECVTSGLQFVNRNETVFVESKGGPFSSHPVSSVQVFS